MKMMVALALLLTIAGYRSDNTKGLASAFVQPRMATTTTAPPSSRAIVADPDRRRTARTMAMTDDYDEEDDGYHRYGGEITMMGRRDAVARFLATSAAAVAVAALPANADIVPASEFSESPTSEYSIARATYDGKDVSAAAEEVPPPPALVAVSKSARARRADFDGNEAGPVGATDGGTNAPVRGAVMAKKETPSNSMLTSSLEPKVNVPVSKEAIAGGAVVLFGLIAIANGNADDVVVEATMTGTPPPTEPYGLAGGRNNAEEVVVAPPVPPPPAPPVAAAASTSWKLEKPTPYGVQNPAGTNPFITEVLEYCEGGKVTTDCAESIKGYLDNIAESGAVATTAEVTAVVGYLGSLGGGGGPAPMTPAKKRVGAAFASYLDALSSGSAPPPSSAKAVKTYLDTLNGTPDAARSVQAQGATSAPDAVVAATGAWDYAAYDNRLTSIEGRVSTLETKVDDLPDRVFEKIAAWQTTYESRLTDEVTKIVNALTSSSASAPSYAAAPEVVHASPPPPAPVAAAEPPMPVAPVVQYTPLAGAVPDRGGLPRGSPPAVSGGPRKGYRFGGGSSWKSDVPTSGGGRPAQNVRTAVPKKFSVGGGGASWKTGKPKGGGGGYLDNMSP